MFLSKVVTMKHAYEQGTEYEHTGVSARISITRGHPSLPMVTRVAQRCGTCSLAQEKTQDILILELNRKAMMQKPCVVQVA